jgi:hypothetical protein
MTNVPEANFHHLENSSNESKDLSGVVERGLYQRLGRRRAPGRGPLSVFRALPLGFAEW